VNRVIVVLLSSLDLVRDESVVRFRMGESWRGSEGERHVFLTDRPGGMPNWTLAPASAEEIASPAATVERLAHGLKGDAVGGATMIRKLKSGEYRLYSRKVDPRTGRRRNLGTFGSRAAAEKHERAVQYFKRRG
jgi:hypothetical protein